MKNRQCLARCCDGASPFLFLGAGMRRVCPKTLCTLMVVGISFLAPSLSAWAESLPASTDSLVMRGIECGYNFDDRAFDDFDEVIRREPDHPRGYFLKASGFFWRVLVHPSDQDARAMMRDFSQQAIDRAEARLDRDDDDVEGLFYLGAAAGNLGRFYGMEDRWLKAYWHGRRGKNALLSLVEIDPDYNNAYGSGDLSLLLCCVAQDRAYPVLCHGDPR